MKNPFHYSNINIFENNNKNKTKEDKKRFYHKIIASFPRENSRRKMIKKRTKNDTAAS